MKLCYGTLNGLRQLANRVLLKPKGIREYSNPKQLLSPVTWEGFSVQPIK